MCNFIPGILLDFSDLLRTKIDIFELKCEKCFPAPAFDTRSKSRARLIGFDSVLSKFTISIPAHSKTQKHVYLWHLLVFLVFLVLKMVDKRYVI